LEVSTEIISADLFCLQFSIKTKIETRGNVSLSTLIILNLGFNQI
jgi:hypothetical protein